MDKEKLKMNLAEGGDMKEQIEQIIKEWEEIAYTNIIDWKERGFESVVHWRADLAYKTIMKIKEVLVNAN